MAQGFKWVYNLSGGRPLVQDLFMKDSETFTLGDMMNLESGEVDLAATGNTGILGVFAGPQDPDDTKNGSPGVVEGTDSTTIVRVIVNPDAVYEDPDDTNSRNAGALLDLTGSTGAQALTGSNNTEFVVVERKRQTADPTRFMILKETHPYIKVQ